MKTLNKFLLIALVIAIAKHSSLATADKDGPKIGDTPPPLTLTKTLQGPPAEEVSWAKLKGKVIVLEFWETRCVPCVAAIPHLNELVGQFKNKPVIFLSVTDENTDYVRNFLKRKPIAGWVAEDGPLAATRAAFHVYGIPHTVIVDASGHIAAITHPSKLEARQLDEILAGRSCSLPAPTPDTEHSVDVVAVSSLPPDKVEVSIQGPFPQPKGAFGFHGWDKSKPYSAFAARKASLLDTLAAFYRVSPKLIYKHTSLPGGLYDISAVGPPDKTSELKEQFAEKFRTHFKAALQIITREVEVYSLTVVSTNAPSLKPASKPGGGGEQPGGFRVRSATMSTVAHFLELSLDKPVIDETQSTNLWAAELKWEMSTLELKFHTRPKPAAVIKAAREQLGLDLTPVKRKLPVLEIRASK